MSHRLRRIKGDNGGKIKKGSSGITKGHYT